MPPKDDPRSERERVVEELHIGIVRRKLTYRVALEMAWDAAIDAAVALVYNEEAELDILALKGDRNVEQSGTGSEPGTN